jgi:hypothetical protein
VRSSRTRATPRVLGTTTMSVRLRFPRTTGSAAASTT